MTIALLDFESLARACRDGDLDAFARQPRLGWRLTEPLRVALIHALEHTNHHGWFATGGSTLTLADALALISEAATNEIGIATTERLRAAVGKELAIGLRVADAVCFGVRYASNLPMNPGVVWPELAPWFKALERNRRRLEQWAESEGVLRFPVVAQPADPDADAAKTGDELLAKIVADPDATEHRLVYADWLIARGDARGELIQLSEHHRSLATRDPELDRRIEQLTKEYGERIAGEVAQLAKHYTLERGFVGRVVMAAPTFAKHGERLVAQHPITELELSPSDAKGLARLAKAPASARLRSLRIGHFGGNQRPVSLASLTDSTLFRSLESLTIRSWTTADDPGDGFAGWQVGKLRQVHLHEVDSASRIIDGLARNEHLRLTSLRVETRWRLIWEPALLAMPALAGLRNLMVRCEGELDPFAGVTLALLEGLGCPNWPSDAPELPRLQRLAILSQEVDARSFTRILAGCPGLRAVELRRIAAGQATRVLELALALPLEHPLVALVLPTDDVDPELIARARGRFPASYYDIAGS